MVKEKYTWGLFAIPLISEFTSQYVHTFWGVMTTGAYKTYNDTSLTGTNSSADEFLDPPSYLEGIFVPSLQSGLSAWMQIVLFWNISSVHFNPAVSFSFLITGRLRPIMFLTYVLVQCLGSTIAALCAKVILNADPSVIVVPDDASSIAVFLNEVIITSIHVFFALAMVMDGTYNQPTGPMAIGLSVFQGSLTMQWVGVACISPSRAFGPVVVTGGSAWNRHWLLWLADLTGAAVAASYYMLFFAPQDKCWLNAFKKKYSKCQTKRNRAQDTVLVGGEDEVKI